MKKIISLFKRNYDGDRRVINEIVEGAEWVAAGQGMATRKFDGTCCLFKDGKLWKRYDAKNGKTPPDGFVAAQDPDPITKHWPGWLPVGDGPEDQWHREALIGHYGNPSLGVLLEGFSDQTMIFGPLYEGVTCELCGPAIQGNPEGFSRHVLVRHGCVQLHHAPRTFDALREFLFVCPFEGIVWHHLDGRMVKIKKSDFWGKARK